jgi:hypothetical protein
MQSLARQPANGKGYGYSPRSWASFDPTCGWLGIHAPFLE